MSRMSLVRGSTVRAAVVAAVSIAGVPAAAERRPITDKRFGAEVREAMAARDADAFRKLIDEADEHVGRWVALVQAAESPQALEWIKRQIERKGVGNDLLAHEISKREAQVAA